jgi:hypothetical protein
MIRSKLGLVFASVAAISIGVIGGKMILSQPGAKAAVSAPKASVIVTTSAPSADEPLRTATPSPASPPIATAPPAASPPPAKIATAPTPDNTPAPAKGPNADTDDDIGAKPNIRFDPDEGEVSIDGGGGGFTISKDRISVRTPFGEIGLDW